MWTHIVESSCLALFISVFFVCFFFLIKMSSLIYDLQSKNWINTYYMLKGFLKARMPPKVSNEMKYTNEKMTWNTQNTNLSSYVPKANVGHTISGKGTSISTLDHSVTTPRAVHVCMKLILFKHYDNINKTFIRDLVSDAARKLQQIWCCILSWIKWYFRNSLNCHK